MSEINRTSAVRIVVNEGVGVSAGEEWETEHESAEFYFEEASDEDEVETVLEDDFEGSEEEFVQEIQAESVASEGDESGFSTPVKAVKAWEAPVGDAEGKKEAPGVGMLFPSMLAVEEYFSAYAKQQGFGIVRASGAKGKGGVERRNTVWTCESFGKPRKAKAKLKVKGPKTATDSIMYEEVDVVTRKSKKCGCPVILYAGVTPNGQWEIRKSVMEHAGHEFTPGKSRKIARNRKGALAKSKHIVRRLFNDRKSRVPVNKIYRCMARERNGVGEMEFSAKDLHEEVRKQRRLVLAKGDAVAMFEYFAKMTSHNQNFFHMHRVDDDGRLQDVIWVDARSRVAYEEFGDVVCFDSTYMTNEYELPFCNFVGVNHHGQSILLGCALLSRETSETFEWLFSSWLLCMGGKKPIGILTDQDPAMRKALKNTMDGTCHRWCIWHILSKFGSKLGMYHGYQEFKGQLENVVYDSLTAEEFVDNWNGVIADYNLQDDDWLQGLFEEREMWVPVYMKHLFWAGMKTTQRVESINSFFDGYVDKHTRLYEFVERYIEAMEARAENEKDADDNCARFVRQTLSEFPQEKIFQSLYTDSKFKEVQRECAKVLYLNCDKRQVSESLWEHTMEDRVWVKVIISNKETSIRKKRWFHVTYDSVTKDVCCECKHFECTGIICRHMVKVWDLHDQFEVPDKYILRRWRKDIPRKHTRVKVAYHDPSKTEVVRRYDRLMVLADPICSNASLHKESTALVIEALQLLTLQVDESVSMIEKRKEEAQRASKVGTPKRGKQNQRGTDLTPSSVTQKRKHDIGTEQSARDDSGTCDELQSGVQSGVGSTPNVLDPVIPPKKAHRTSDLRLRSSVEISMKHQAARLRKSEAARKKAAREKARVERQKVAEQKKLEIEQRKLEKQQAAELRRAEKEKAMQQKKEERERVAMEKKIQKERVLVAKQQQKSISKCQHQPLNFDQQHLLQECHHLSVTCPLVIGETSASASVSRGGIQMSKGSGSLTYFTTPPPAVMLPNINPLQPLPNPVQHEEP